MFEDLNVTKDQGDGDGAEKLVMSEGSDLETKVSEDELVQPPTETQSPQETSEGDLGENLPPEVTEEPQSPEHIDLRKVKPYRTWLKAYLDVSDDQGDFLRDKALEMEVKELCGKLDSLDLSKEQDFHALIEQVKDTLIRYATTVNLSENISAGIITKYRIRQGMLLLHQKRLVTKGLKENWIEWFKKNYDASLLRSYQDYMRIAGVKNAIKYAVFGKERLIGIIRQLHDTDGEDPIGDFLAENGIEFNTDVESDSEEIRLKADIAINQRKLVSEELGEIPLDKIKAFVETGNMITPKHIRELKLVKQKGDDLSSYMDGLIASGGKPQPVMTPERKAATYKSALVSFLDKTKEAISDQEYIGEIALDLCKELKDRIEELEKLISSKLGN